MIVQFTNTLIKRSLVNVQPTEGLSMDSLTDVCPRMVNGLLKKFSDVGSEGLIKIDSLS